MVVQSANRQSCIKLVLLLLLQVVVKSLAAMCCGSQRNQDLARQAGSYIHTDNNAVACHANITLWLKVKWFDWVAGGLHGWRRGSRDGECSKLASSSSHPHIPPIPTSTAEEVVSAHTVPPVG